MTSLHEFQGALTTSPKGAFNLGGEFLIQKRGEAGWILCFEILLPSDKAFSRTLSFRSHLGHLFCL